MSDLKAFPVVEIQIGKNMEKEPEYDMAAAPMLGLLQRLIRD